MGHNGAAPHAPAVPSSIGTSLEWALAAAGCAAALAAALLAPHHTLAAAAQVWPPFVLVAGLLLVGLWPTKTVCSCGRGRHSPGWLDAAGCSTAAPPCSSWP